MARMLIVGLDGLNPELIRDWLDDLPNLKRMQQEGIWGEIESTIPPHPVPAWVSAQSSRNPGAFGFWSLRYRDEFYYDLPKVADCTIKEKRVEPLYKILARFGQKVAVISLPTTWPPPKIPGGYSVSCYMTPQEDTNFTWPTSFKDEIEKVVGKYIIDLQAKDYLQMNRQKLLNDIHIMDSQRCALLKYLISKKQCDFVWLVLTGPDRIGHFCLNKTSVDKELLHEYYSWLDAQIGEVCAAINTDTFLLIHSAYSVQEFWGRINLNEWLVQEGYLVLENYPSKPTLLSQLKVNWAKTKVWAVENNLGQIYVNLKGREQAGSVDVEDYDVLLDEIANKLKMIENEEGNVLKVQVFKRRDIHFGPYAEYGPDLFVLFENGRWQTSELVGYGPGKIFSFDPVLLSEEGAHGPVGYFCLIGPGISAKGEQMNVSLVDIAPTVLELMDLKAPKEMEGKTIVSKEEITVSSKEADKVRSRLKFLGY